MAKYIAYYRVSTKKQGLGLEAQQASVMAYINSEADAELLAEYSEKESGKYSTREQLNKAMQRANNEGATLLIAKLDRLSRDVEFLFHLQKAVSFKALDLPVCNTMTLAIFAGLAQQERELISQRTKAALAAKKAQGIKLGAPNAKFTDEMRAAAKAQHSQNAKENQNNKRAYKLASTMRASGSSLHKIAAELNEGGFLTSRGKQWTAKGVSNLLDLYSK